MVVSQQHLAELQRYIAKMGTTASSLRNQGGRGLVSAAIAFLASLDLTQLANQTPTTYPQWLDAQTNSLVGQFPVTGLWGGARKVINIFMVMASSMSSCDQPMVSTDSRTSLRCRWTTRSSKS